jgi:6-phosphogluconolactonase
MSTEPQVRILGSPQELFRAAAVKFWEIGARAIQERGRFAVALSGGSTPRGLHQKLAANFASRLPWDKVFFFWGDERHVPPDSPESNYRMASETLFSKLPIPTEHIFRIQSELPDPGEAAQAYEQNLRDFFHPAPGAFPRFDFILLGMGPDGHTASLFPGTTALEEHEHLVVANWVEKLNAFRITLTYPVLNHAGGIMFLISGGEKAEMVATALQIPGANLPCQRVRPEKGELLWFLDAEAAAKLS